MNAATTAAAPHFLLERRSRREGQLVRAESQRKRAEVYDAIAADPDADEGLKAQARFYRERLEAGMRNGHDA